MLFAIYCMYILVTMIRVEHYVGRTHFTVSWLQPRLRFRTTVHVLFKARHDGAHCLVCVFCVLVLVLAHIFRSALGAQEYGSVARAARARAQLGRYCGV